MQVVMERIDFRGVHDLVLKRGERVFPPEAVADLLVKHFLIQPWRYFAMGSGGDHSADLGCLIVLGSNKV